MSFNPTSKKLYSACERDLPDHRSLGRSGERGCAGAAYACVVPRCDFPRSAALAQRPAKGNARTARVPASPALAPARRDKQRQYYCCGYIRPLEGAKRRGRAGGGGFSPPSRARQAFAAGRTKFRHPPTSRELGGSFPKR